MKNISEENKKLFHHTLDALMLAQYKDCQIIDGWYHLPNEKLMICSTVRSYYFELSRLKHSKFFSLKHKSFWTNDSVKCGFTLTANTGKTYSYPGLRKYIGDETEEDAILRASYFFACISQMISFFEGKNTNIKFSHHSGQPPEIT
jgi:hypothetical protein